MRSARLLHRFVEFPVSLDLGPARRRQLREAEAAAKFRVPLQQQLHRQQSLLDALGVVQAIHADAQQCIRLQSKLSPHLRAALLGAGRRLHPADRPFKRDRIRTDQRAVPLHHHRILFPVYAGFQIAVHGVQKIVAVQLRVEAENAASQQAFKQFVAPGADAHPLGVGPGNMPEHNDGCGRQALANHRRAPGRSDNPAPG